MIKKKKKYKRKKFCPNGHEYALVGQHSNGHCKKCSKMHKQFCVHGHDTWVTGRTQNGVCKVCNNTVHHVDPIKKEKRRLKRHTFCPKGHNKDVEGRLKDGTCKKCKKNFTKPYGKRYYKKNKKHISKRQKKWRNAHREEIKDYDLKKVYGISLKDYDRMEKKQNFRCLGCRIHRKQLGQRFCVDHDHKTGKVRGLLCYKCNSVLGYLKDDVKILKRLIKYLNKNKEK